LSPICPIWLAAPDYTNPKPPARRCYDRVAARHRNSGPNPVDSNPGAAANHWLSVKRPTRAQITALDLDIYKGACPLAGLPVLVLVLGIGETSKVSLVVYAGVFPVVLGTIAGVRSTDPLLVKAACAMGIGHVALLAKVVLPGVVPSVLTGIR
jgi:hypothetical protein